MKFILKLAGILQLLFLMLFILTPSANALTCISCDTIGGVRVDATSSGPTTHEQCENALYSEFLSRGEVSRYAEGRIYQFDDEPPADCTIPTGVPAEPTLCPFTPTVTFGGTGEVSVVGETGGAYNVVAKLRVGSENSSLCPLGTAGQFYLTMQDSSGTERGISSGTFEVGADLYTTTGVSLDEVMSKLGKNIGDTTNATINVIFPGSSAYPLYRTIFTISAAAAGGPGSPVYQYVSTPPVLQIPIPTLPNFGDFAPATPEGEVPNRYLSIPWIGQYIGAIYQYIIGVVGILAGIMIMVAGLIWLTAGGSAERIGAARKYLEGALVGLVISLTSFLVLYAINPALVTFENLKVQFIERADIPFASPSVSLYDTAATPDGASRAFVSNEDYKIATGEDIPTKAEVVAIAEEVASEKGLDKCFLLTIVAKESGYKANRIGHDEDVPRAQVGARPKLIRSGKKYSGATFESNSALITDSSFRNDDRFNPNAPPDYGLDPRFTHGIGLGQLTILDEDHDGDADRCPDGKMGRVFGRQCYNVLELFDARTTLEISADLIKRVLSRSSVNNKPEQLFYQYAGQGCSARVSQCKKMKEYASCKGNPSLASQERDDCLSWVQGGESKENCKNPAYR
jgi:hypothetical protein